MGKKILFSLFIIGSFLACDNKTQIDESIVAKTETSTEKSSDIEDKTYRLKTTENKIIEFTINKTGIDFKDFKEKKAVLINMFATWCPPCVEEIPILKELRKKYGDNFEIVSVLFEKDKPKKDLEDFIKKHNITYPITIGEENFELAKDLGDIQKVPEMFLFSKKGKFVQKFIGSTKKEKLEEAVLIAIDN